MAQATKEAESQSTESVLKEILARQDKMEGKIKGLAGQQGRLAAKIGLEKPGEPINKSQSSQNGAIGGESKPQEAATGHKTYDWMPGCPGCGGAENVDFKAPPNLWCKDCGAPLGRVESEADITKIAKCWNWKGDKQCGSTKASRTPPKQVVF